VQCSAADDHDYDDCYGHGGGPADTPANRLALLHAGGWHWHFHRILDRRTCAHPTRSATKGTARTSPSSKRALGWEAQAQARMRIHTHLRHVGEVVFSTGRVPQTDDRGLAFELRKFPWLAARETLAGGAGNHGKANCQLTERAATVFIKKFCGARPADGFSQARAGGVVG